MSPFPRGINSIFLVYSFNPNYYTKVPSFGYSIPEALSMTCSYGFSNPVSTHTDLQLPFVACFKSCCRITGSIWKFCDVFLHQHTFVDLRKLVVVYYSISFTYDNRQHASFFKKDLIYYYQYNDILS